MLGDITPLEARKRSHSDIVKLRKQEGVDEVSPFDRELWVIDRLFGNLETERPRPQEAATASPIQFGFQLAGASDKEWQIKLKKVMTFYNIWIAFFNQAR